MRFCVLKVEHYAAIKSKTMDTPKKVNIFIQRFDNLAITIPPCMMMHACKIVETLNKNKQAKQTMLIARFLR